MHREEKPGPLFIYFTISNKKIVNHDTYVHTYNHFRVHSITTVHLLFLHFIFLIFILLILFFTHFVHFPLHGIAVIPCSRHNNPFYNPWPSPVLPLSSPFTTSVFHLSKTFYHTLIVTITTRTITLCSITTTITSTIALLRIKWR